MSPNEAKVLTHLAEEYCEDFGFLNFKPIMAATGLPRSVVRRACRSLKRKGLAKFASGLCTEDGEMAGSGYSATAAGLDWYENQPSPAHAGDRRSGFVL